jgi:hypothetical protein
MRSLKLVGFAVAFTIALIASPSALSEEVSLPLDIRAGDSIEIRMKSTGSQETGGLSNDRTQKWTWLVRVEEYNSDGGVWSFQLIASESVVPQYMLINRILEGRTLRCEINLQGDCTKLLDWERLQSQLLAGIAATPDGVEKQAVQSIFQRASETSAPRLLIRNYSAVASVQGRKWLVPERQYTEVVSSNLAGGAPIAQTTTLSIEPGVGDGRTRVGFRVVSDGASLSASWRESLKAMVQDLSVDPEARREAADALGRVRAESSANSTASIDELSGLVMEMTIESRLTVDMPHPFADKSSRRVDTVEISQMLSRQ